MIRFDGITLTLGEKNLFQNLSFQINLHSKYILSGKSGTGKSTLLKMLLGFLKPDAGTITVDGQHLSGKTIWSIRNTIAYVDQEVQLGHTSFDELLAACFHYRANRHIQLNNQRKKELFDYLELPEQLAGNYMPELSGGERQRLGLVLALLLDRKILLLDEITSALDKHLKKKVVELVATLDDRTIMAIGHDSVWQESPDFKKVTMEEQVWTQ